MSVFRVEKTKNYTVMANYHLQDRNLSLAAKGLLSFMLSLPEDWNYTLAGLACQNDVGVKTIRSILRELEREGYLSRTQRRGENGHFEYEYSIFEKSKGTAPYSRAPHAQPPHTPSGHAVKGTLLNTNIQSTNEQSTNIQNISDTSNNKKPYNPLVSNSTGGRISARVFKKPTMEELEDFKKENELTTVDTDSFFNYYESNGWRVGKQPMKNWKAAMRNWHARNLKENPRTVKSYPQPTKDPDSEPYEPKPTEDIREWRDYFDEWERIIGMRPAQTVGNVKSALLLKKENDDETNLALMVALALRSETGYLTREVKSIATPADLYKNRERVWAFYQEHREEWQWKHGRGDKKPWEL